MKVAEPFHLHGQMSDSFRAAVFIILSGGFQDAAERTEAVPALLYGSRPSAGKTRP